MAYMSQEHKKQIAEKAKKVLKKYGVKGSFAVRHHSTIVCNIKSSKMDLIGNWIETMSENPRCNMENLDYMRQRSYISINPYHFKDHFTGRPLKFMTELMECLQEGNWDKSDIMTDYFNVGWYVDVNIGKWDKPYEYLS